MTPAITIVLIVLVAAMILFSIERIPVDIVALILVFVLVLSRVLTAEEALAGFGNDIVVTISGLFILTGGLVKTGVVDALGRQLHRIAGGNVLQLTMLVMVIAALSAAVMKNTTTTAMLLPMVLALSERARIQPSKLLMPLAFAAILGGTCTLMGTSTNLAVSGLLPRYGLRPYTMFELAPVGLAVVVVGFAYMAAVGGWLLPNRQGGGSIADRYNIREYVSEVLVLETSPLIGKTLAEANLPERLDLTVIGVVREKDKHLFPTAGFHIRSGDLLLVQGRIEDILRIKTEAGIEIKADFKLSDKDLESDGVRLFEVMVLRGAGLVGNTLKNLRFRETHGLTVLAVSRHSATLLSKISKVSLRFGDVLLVQGTRERVDQLLADGNLLLEDVTDRRGRPGKRRWAIAAFLLFLCFSVTHLLPLSMAALFGVFVLLATRAVLVKEFYRLIEWRLVVLIAGMMSFGAAMEKTGADKFLADLIVRQVGGYGDMAVLAGFFVLTLVLTQPMSNQAAALVVLPVAVEAAQTLGLNPRAFAVTITYAASCSFLTPLEPACVLIYTPGRYRFIDFVKVGSILTLFVFVVVMVLVPIFWPLR